MLGLSIELKSTEKWRALPLKDTSLAPNSIDMIPRQN